LDIEGVNYDVTAEIDCCCEYPVLGVEFLPLYNGNPLLLGGFEYTNDFGETYGIVSGRMLLRDFRLYTQEGASIEIKDSLSVPIEGGGQRMLKNDIVYVDRLSPRTYPLRAIPVNNFFDFASLSMGMDGEFCRINPFGLPSNSALGRAMNGLYEPKLEEVFSMRLELLTDTLGGIQTRKILYFPICQSPLPKRELGRAGLPGFNFTLPLKMDFKILLGEIHLSELDSIAVLENWESSLRQSIFFQ
jgi:hypothetical protein